MHSFRNPIGCLNVLRVCSRRALQRIVSRRKIELGAMSPKLSAQLVGLNVPKDRLRILDKLADSVTWCFLNLNGLLTDTEHQRAGKRLIAKVNMEVRKAANDEAQRLGPRRRWIATWTRWPGSLQRSCSATCERTKQSTQNTGLPDRW